jgi:hypothetical protein
MYRYIRSAIVNVMMMVPCHGPDSRELKEVEGPQPQLR